MSKQATTEQASSAKAAAKAAEAINWARIELFTSHQGSYRSHRLPPHLWGGSRWPRSYRTPLGRSVRAQFQKEWAAADRLEQHDRTVAARQEYLPAEEQTAFWRGAGMVWRQEMPPALVGGVV